MLLPSRLCQGEPMNCYMKLFSILISVVYFSTFGMERSSLTGHLENLSQVLTSGSLHDALKLVLVTDGHGITLLYKAIRTAGGLKDPLQQGEANALIARALLFVRLSDIDLNTIMTPSSTSLLHGALVSNRHNAALIKILLANNLNPDQRNNLHVSPLMSAISDLNIEAVRLLLAARVSVTFRELNRSKSTLGEHVEGSEEYKDAYTIHTLVQQAYNALIVSSSATVHVNQSQHIRPVSPSMRFYTIGQGSREK